jgi:hypothetical protein
MPTLEQFAEEVKHDVRHRIEPATGTRQLSEEAFTDFVLERLVEHNEALDHELCRAEWSARGAGNPAARVTAWHLAEDGARLDLFITEYLDEDTPPVLSRSEVETLFKKLRGFLKRALAGFHTELESSSSVFEAARRIHEAKSRLSTVHLHVLTDSVVKKADITEESLEGLELRYVLWDLEKLARLRGGERGTIELDFAEDYDGPVPALEMADSSGEYRTYLAFLPASLLVRIYGEHGQRLLERNVRAFLQAKGKINKGLQETLRDEPHRFLAYNNGLCCTAAEVEVETNDDGHALLKAVKDFQIVNGGQTTASIYHAHKAAGLDVEDVRVQMKLTVLSNPDDVIEVVPLISKYANSQNKVNTADFSANGPFHRALEELSRTRWAPATSGLGRGSRWYYERARGSYEDDKFKNRTPAAIKRWEAEHPRAQRFTKTDLAKFEHCWDGYPFWVCTGAEKNFVKWTDRCEEQGWPVVDEDYFQELVAKALLFKAADRVVAEHDEIGYKAQIVAYTLAFLTTATGKRLPLRVIWEKQAVPAPIVAALEVISREARAYLTNPPGGRNISEWSKRADCWESFLAKKITLPAGLRALLVETPHEARRAAGNQEKVKETVAAAQTLSAEQWFALAKWAKERDHLQGWQRSLSVSMGRLAAQGRPPSPKQAAQAVKIIASARELGFAPESVGTN